MTVKDMIIETAKYIGEDDFIKAISSGQPLDEQTQAMLDKMLCAYNSVLGEISVSYEMPNGSVDLPAGKTDFTAFPNPPIKIIGCYAKDGKQVSATTTPTFIYLPYPAEVVYKYIPSNKVLTDEHIFADSIIKSYIYAYGIASEYCIMSGRYSEADNWAEKYRCGLDSCFVLKGAGKVKARKWGV